MNNTDLQKACEQKFYTTPYYYFFPRPERSRAQELQETFGLPDKKFYTAPEYFYTRSADRFTSHRFFIYEDALSASPARPLHRALLNQHALKHTKS